jgi:transcriptional regulator with XRE-family HTH domain
MSNDAEIHSVDMRAAIALRAARTALGWSQEDAARSAGLAKTTIARLETATGGASLHNIFSLISTYKNYGIVISDLMQETVTISYNTATIQEAIHNLSNPDRKRSDTGSKRNHNQ